MKKQILDKHINNYTNDNKKPSNSIKAICCITGCTKPVFDKGLCTDHHNEIIVYGRLKLD